MWTNLIIRNFRDRPVIIPYLSRKVFKRVCGQIIKQKRWLIQTNKYHHFGLKAVHHWGKFIWHWMAMTKWIACCSGVILGEKILILNEASFKGHAYLYNVYMSWTILRTKLSATKFYSFLKQLEKFYFATFSSLPPNTTFN